MYVGRTEPDSQASRMDMDMDMEMHMLKYLPNFTGQAMGAYSADDHWRKFFMYLEAHHLWPLTPETAANAGVYYDCEELRPEQAQQYYEKIADRFEKSLSGDAGHWLPKGDKLPIW